MPRSNAYFVIYAVQDIFYPAQTYAKPIGDLFAGQFVPYQIEYFCFTLG
jgi:hypothetical protein